MPISSDTARAWVDVDLGALLANARAVQATSGRPLLPMVKANGYGLGAVAVARALEAVGPWGFGVASPDEALPLRSAGIDRPILVTSPMLPDWGAALRQARLRPTIGDLDALDRWIASSDDPFHIEVDTGMSRAGFRWDDRAGIAALIERVRSAPGFEGIFTHFHSADTDRAATDLQWSRFQEVLAALPRRPALVHAANSAGALAGSRYAADLVRPGIFLYGGRAGGPDPAAVAALRARVLAVRRVAAGETVGYGAAWTADAPCTVATIGAGYGDGVLRSSDARMTGRLPARELELGGACLPLVGRVTMDMCMVRVDDQAVAPGDVATFFGGRVTLDDAADAAGTISYELLTALAPRVPRRYHGAF